MITRALLVAVGLLVQPVVFAQTPPPALVVSEESGLRTLRVTSIEVDAKIHGHFSETHVTMDFYNESSRALAGDFYFPLPLGSTVSGYALDVDGRMVDGVVVEKERARTVFEKIVRQGIDPGLVEWVSGNNFKTRVFPIPPRGSRTVRVAYIAPLAESVGNKSFRIPLQFDEPIDRVDLRIEVIKPQAEPIVTSSQIADLTFARWRESYVAEAALQDALLMGDIVIELPSLERMPFTVERSSDGKVYFAITSTPAIPTSKLTIAPRRVTVYWDGSHSHAESDIESELELLSAFLGRVGTVTVDLVIFRDSPEQSRRFDVSAGNSTKLLEAIRRADYDGGTQLGALPLPVVGSDYCLLFTDGNSTIGESVPPRFDVPLFVLSADKTANHAVLRSLAESNGGAYFNVERDQIGSVADRIGEPVYSFLRARVTEGNTDIHPRNPRAITGPFVVSGITSGATAGVSLEFGYVGGAAVEELHYSINLEAAESGEMNRIIWAQNKLESLLTAPEQNAGEIVALGKEHGLVTPGTSLLVLESLDQYIEHRVDPPSTLPQMRSAYFERVSEIAQVEKNERMRKFEWVYERWKTRIAWWEETYRYKEGFVYAEAGEGGASEIAPVVSDESAADGSGALPISSQEAPMEPESAPELAARASGARESEEEASSDSLDSGGQAEITLRPWDPETPYLAKLKAAKPMERYEVYLVQSELYGESPAFYLDSGDYFLNAGSPGLARRIWSNIVELELENPVLVRVLAHRLAQENMLELAKLLFEQVLRLRNEEPQSYRDLALVLGRLGDFNGAIDLLYQVVVQPWDRFEEIELIALTELNSLIPKAVASGGFDVSTIDPRLIKLLDVDVRIILTWDADLTDMDLWVIEPSGEKAFYANQRTTIGGNFSRDFTQGYGPEEYMVRRAMPGEYQILVNYYSSSALSLIGSVTLQVDVFTNFGRENENRQSLTVRLTESSETIEVGSIQFSK